MPVHSHEGLLDENEGTDTIALCRNSLHSHSIKFILVLFVYSISSQLRFQMYFICGADGCGMKHTLHAMDFLRPGGRLITLAHHYTLAPSHKDEFFFSWLKTFNAQVIDLGRPFSDGERKTNIPINLIVVDKPSF